MIVKLKEQGARIIIIDAITEDDLELIANAVVDSKVKFVAVDPGVFTGVVCKILIPPSKQEYRGKILVAVGSVNGVAASQVFNFLKNHRPHNVYIDAEAFVRSESSRYAEINRVVHEALECTGHQVISAVGSGVFPQNRFDFGKYEKALNLGIEGISNILNDSIAEVAYQILLKDCSFKGLYTSGGDISVSVCKRLGAYGMKLQSEVQPLASFGEIWGGEFQGMKYITKGGMVGDENALNVCIDYLKGAVN